LGGEDNNAKETRAIGTTAMDGSNGKRRIHHGRMVSKLRPKEDKVVTRLRHNYNADDEGFRRDRFSFNRQEGYYEYQPFHVYLSSGHSANKTTLKGSVPYIYDVIVSMLRGGGGKLGMMRFADLDYVVKKDF
jgi:hypothetical protein